MAKPRSKSLMLAVGLQLQVEVYQLEWSLLEEWSLQEG